MNIEILKNKILSDVYGCEGEDEIIFSEEKGEQYRLFHRQDCCERVTIEDIEGDLNDLTGVPLLLVEETTNEGEIKNNDETFTWTFYKFATIKGFVTIRWYGFSNGCYSEKVHFEKIRHMWN